MSEEPGRTWVREGPGGRVDGSAAEAFARGARAAAETLRSWPGYAPTPLLDLPGVAGAAGVGAVRVKDESGRFGVGSFKALGGGWATARALARALDPAPPTERIVAGEASDRLGDVTVCCATDGNHGRAVAWAARRFGCRAVVYLPRHALPIRTARIRALGAETVEVDGGYDEAVAAAADDARREGWVLVSDTGPGASGGDEEGSPSRWVLEGYALLVDEALDAMEGPPPTHAFVQAGVGGLAGAVAARLAGRLGEDRPRIVVVEPERAPCVLRSLEARRPATLEGDLTTVMDCLSAGHVSAAAWPFLRALADGAVTVPDRRVEEVRGRLRVGHGDDPPLDGGPSGVSGLAGLLAVAGDPGARDRLGLGADARVLAFMTEESLEPGAGS